jgi:hypothetical protein
MPEGDDVCAQIAPTPVDGGPAQLDELVSSGGCHGRIDVWPSMRSSVGAEAFRLNPHVFQLRWGGLAGTALNPWSEDRTATEHRAAPPRGAILHVDRGRVDHLDEQSRELHTASIWEASQPTDSDQGLVSGVGLLASPRDARHERMAVECSRGGLGSRQARCEPLDLGTDTLKNL